MSTASIGRRHSGQAVPPGAATGLSFAVHQITSTCSSGIIRRN